MYYLYFKRRSKAIFLFLSFFFSCNLASHSQIPQHAPDNLCAVLQKVTSHSSTGFKALRLGKVEPSDYEQYTSSLQLDGHIDACAVQVDAFDSGLTEWVAACPLDDKTEMAALAIYKDWYSSIQKCAISLDGRTYKFSSAWQDGEDGEFELQDAGLLEEMTIVVNENRMIFLTLTLLPPGDGLLTYFLILSVYEME
jgi:hypothetical protein